MWKKNAIILSVLVFAIIIYQYGGYIFGNISEVISSRVTTNVEGVEAENREMIEEDTEEIETVDVILDPGHGGSDPGVVGINQALEAEINLKIAWKVYDLLIDKGYTVLLTREDENGMDPTGEMSKVEDLAARVSMINEVSPELVVSIHQNSYSDESIYGAQVFYYTSSTEGMEAAQIMQESLLEVEPDNTRQIESNATYYLLNKTIVPIIIVECGFLSNASDADKLIEDSYQQEVAEAIASGIIEYLEESML